MKIIGEFISEYGASILYTVITAIIGYLLVAAKNALYRYISNKEKREVIRCAVFAVEQSCCDKHGQEKLNEAVAAAEKVLSDRKISVSCDEMRVLIEATLAEMNNVFGEKDNF